MIKKKNIFEFIKPFILDEIVCCIFLLIYSITSVLYPYLFKMIIDEGISQRNIDNLVKYTSFMFLSIILMALTNYIQSIRFLKLGQKFILKLKEKILQNLSRCLNTFSRKYTNGEILSILENDINKIEQLAIHMISNIIVNFIVVMGVFGIIFSISPIIGLVSLCLVSLYTLCHKIIGTAMKNKSLSLAQCQGELISNTEEIIGNLYDLKVLNVVTYFLNKYIKKHKEFFEKEKVVITINQYSMIAGMIFQSLGLAVVLAYGGIMVLNNKMSIGILFTLSLYIQRIYDPVIKLASSYVEIKKIQASIKRVYDLLGSTEDRIQEGTMELKEESCMSPIVVKDFSYGYEDRILVKDSEFTISKNDKVAIIGANGCGKTTLIKLLLRLDNNYKGKILLYGKPIEQYKLNEIRKNMISISQNAFIFNGTIRENILLDNNISEERLNDIILMSCLEEDIKNMHQGLDTLVGEKGLQLSGGQAQKINLARCFVYDYKVLIIDEPTSALDIESEKVICKNLFDNMSDKIIITITHRPEILKYCNKIFKIEENKFHISDELQYQFQN